MSDTIEPSVERQMKIPPLEVPEFHAHIKEEQLGDLETLSRPERAILLNLSIVDQKMDFCIAQLVTGNRHMRHLEAEQIAQRDKVERIDRGYGVMRWIGASLLTGMLVTAGGLLLGIFRMTQ